MAEPSTMKVILHAPTSNALARARNNAANLKREVPDANVRIIANAEAVAAALDDPHPDTDALVWLCPNSLARSGRESRVPLQVLDQPAVLEIVLKQSTGWAYVRS
ncbi:hypothetical protein SDC9_85536 [bioreactor metagenome]|uniref:Uncharacterized protein n=1 Tax=bioreactor metagenome TaxID=1076179 RepID=A0A644ZDE6_9ZZZZ